MVSRLFYLLLNAFLNKRYAPYIPTIRPSSSPSSTNKGFVCKRSSRRFPPQAPATMGMASTKPIPLKADSDSQTEGGGFWLILQLSSLYRLHFSLIHVRI